MFNAQFCFKSGRRLASGAIGRQLLTSEAAKASGAIGRQLLTSEAAKAFGFKVKPCLWSSIIPYSSGSPSSKGDPAWKYCMEIIESDGSSRSSRIQCKFCQKIFRGGGVTRLKQHLAGVAGQVTSCKKVPDAVKTEMKELLDHLRLRKAMEEGGGKLGRHSCGAISRRH